MQRCKMYWFITKMNWVYVKLFVGHGLDHTCTCNVDKWLGYYIL